MLRALDESLKRILRVVSYRISWNIKSWGHLGSVSSSKLQFYRSVFVFFWGGFWLFFSVFAYYIQTVS